MRTIILILATAAFILLPFLAFGQTSGQNVLDRKNAGAGFTRESFTISNGQLLGRTSGGVLSGMTLGTGFAVSGTTITVPAPTVAIGDITGLQTALDGKASLSGSYANPAWITSLPFSKLTSLPTTLIGHGITEFQTDAFILTNVTNSLTSEQRGLGRVSGRDTMQAGGGTLQWYQSGAERIMAWSGRLQAQQLDLSAVSIFTTVPSSSTAPGEAGQMAYDSTYLYICVALNSWRRIALSSW